MRDRVETERLLLRLPEAEDVPALVAYYLENRAHLEPWSPAWPSGFFSQAFWREQVRLARAELEADTAVRFFIFERAAPRRVVGNLSLSQIQRGPLQQCLLGYGLASDCQGRGYMLEAVCAAVRYAFEELRLHRVMANYLPHNRRSAAVLRRAGFSIEGYARDYLLINGKWEDHVLTAVVNPDWISER